MVETAARRADARPSPARDRRLLDAGILALAALAARLPAYLCSRHLVFDDAVYGASAIAMRSGGRPFVDVFSSQGPLHLPLIWVFDLLAGRTSSAPRTASLLGGVAATVLTYLIGRRITDRGPAVVAAAVVALSGSVLWTTGPITADGPALAIALGAVLLAMQHRDRPSTAHALLVGAVLGVALSVKAPLVLLASIPVAGLMLAARRPRDLVVAAAGAGAVGLAASLPWGLGRVWDQSVGYQLDSERNASFLTNIGKIFSTLYDRDLALLVLVVVALVAVVADRREAAPSGEGPTVDLLAPRLIAAWLAALFLFLTVEPALWRNHLAHLVAPAALLGAYGLRSRRMLLVAIGALVVTAPFHLASNHDILLPAGYSQPAAAAVGAIRALPAGARAISDDPGLVWRAGRETPPDLVDTSIKRIQQGRITSADVARQAADRRVCAVLVWSRSHFGSFPDLAARLDDEGYELRARYRGDRALYVRRSCRPRD